jgi:hypothetical protein
MSAYGVFPIDPARMYPGLVVVLWRGASGVTSCIREARWRNKMGRR